MKQHAHAHTHTPHIPESVAGHRSIAPLIRCWLGLLKSQVMLRLLWPWFLAMRGFCRCVHRGLHSGVLGVLALEQATMAHGVAVGCGKLGEGEGVQTDTVAQIDCLRVT